MFILTFCTIHANILVYLISIYNNFKIYLLKTEGEKMSEQTIFKNISTGESSDADFNTEISLGNSGTYLIECPSCSYPIITNSTDTTVRCPCCNTVINTSQPAPADSAHQKVLGISTVSAAKAYIDFVFKSFDWTNFCKNDSVFSIPEIDALLHNLKTTQGDNPEIWKLSFSYSARCIEEKVNNVDVIQNDIIKKYMSADDLENCYYEYDCLYESLQILKEKRFSLISELNNYINFANQYGLSDDECDAMKAQAKSLNDKIKSLALVSNIEEHPDVAKEIERKAMLCRERYAAAGIDADAEYKAGIKYYEENNFDAALACFTRIPEYNKASEYIEKINKVYVLSNKYFYMDKKVYFYKSGLYFEKDKLADYQNCESQAFNSYLGCFGTRFYYTVPGDNSQIYYQNLSKPERKDNKVTVYYADAYGNLEYYSNVEYQPETIIYLTKYDPILNAAKKNKFLKSKGIKSKLSINRKLNYGPDWNDILALDMSTGKFSVLAEGVYRISKITGDTIYYVAPNFEYKRNGTVSDIKGESLYSYNIVTHDNKKLITGNSTLYELNDSSIIFTRQDHGQNNLTIYTKRNIEGAEEVALVKNVYNFYKFIKGKIYYMVGNANIKSLCSIRPDGTDQREIMKYMMDIVFTSGDWMYVTRGAKDNIFRTLYRIPLVGGEPKKVAFGVISSDLDKPCIRKGYLYYTDYNAELCRVRLDGTNQQSLVQGVRKILMVNYDKVFYLSYDGKERGHNIISLYEMNMDGSNRRKLIYNVESIHNVENKYFIYVREDALESKREVYSDVKDLKLNKLIAKIYNKYDKKKKHPVSKFKVISLYNCETGDNEILAYDCSYPVAKELKLEMKEVLRR